LENEEDALDHVLVERAAISMTIAWQWYTINQHVVARDSEENNKPGPRQAE
jgi:hypothetical protein